MKYMTTPAVLDSVESKESGGEVLMYQVGSVGGKNLARTRPRAREKKDTCLCLRPLAKAPKRTSASLRIIIITSRSTMMPAHQSKILRRYAVNIASIRLSPSTMTRRPIVFAFAVFTAAAQGADVSRRPYWGTRPSSSRAFVTESYERLFRGGSDAEEQPRSIIETYDTSVCSVQGGRAYMEDEYCINQNGAFAAVFDGHGGTAVSRYLRQNLYANVQAAAPASTVQECADALKAALKKVDVEVQRISHWSFQGSTAVVAWVVTEDRPGRGTKEVCDCRQRG